MNDVSPAERLSPGQGGPVTEPVALKRRLLRWAPAAIVLAALCLAYALGLHRYVSMEALRDCRDSLSGFVGRHPLAAGAAYVAIYVAAVGVSFPGASALTAAGGFMFGCVLGSILALGSATAGACIVFLAARTAIGDALTRRAGPRMRQIRAGFADDGFSYLLSIRLVPLFPFWLVNLAASLVGMRLAPYAAATAIGILPGTVAIAYFGQGLGSAIEDAAPGGAPVNLAGTLLLPMLVLALLALLPVLTRKWMKRNGHG